MPCWRNKMTTARKLMRIADFLTDKGYHIGQQIGEGTYAKVRSAERRSDGRMCAVKIVDRWKAKKDYLKKFMPRELEIVLRLKHKNVIRTFEVYQHREFVIQVMQYAERGDLLQTIHQHGVLAEEKAKPMFHGIAQGLQYLHEMNVAHRDLKCENVLVFQDKSVAITDFGFARSFENPSDMMCETFCGSTSYASPELLRAVPYDPKINDVWSLGVVLYIMLTGTMPFDDTNVTKMIQAQLSRNVKFPERTRGKISGRCKLLIAQLLEPAVALRTTADLVLVSGWLKDVPVT